MFKRKPQPDGEGFYPTELAAVAVTENNMTTLTINGKPVIVSCWAGEIYAFSAHCPHAAADLAKGELYKGRIDCPEHGWRFDLKTGRTLYPPDEACRLKKYTIKIVDEQVWVRVS